MTIAIQYSTIYTAPQIP